MPLKFCLLALLALGMLPAAPAHAFPPAPEETTRKPFAGDHQVLPIRVKGRVVFSGDGKRIAWINGGKIYVADLATLTKRGWKVSKLPQVADVDAKQTYLDGLFLPGAKGPLVAVTAKGLRAVGTDAVAVKAAGIDVPGVRPVALSPNGKLLAVSGSAGLRLLRVGGKEVDAKALRGTSFGAWAEDSKALYVVNKDNEVVRVELPGGKAKTVVSGAALKKTCGVDIGRVAVRAVRGKGEAAKVFLLAWQKAVVGKGFNPGVHIYPVPEGAKRRGRNPGSAEPGPEPPSWAILASGGKLKVIDVIWKARWIDDVLVLPARKLDRFLFAQMAQGGAAGDGNSPEVWLGSIDTAGKKKEKALPKGTFPPTMRDLSWQVLDVKDDASKALVLVTANLVVRIPVKGPLDMPLLMMKYGRLGGQMDGKFAVLKFQSWSLWSFDAGKGTMKRVSKLYAEKVDELKKVSVGLKGKLGTLADYDRRHFLAYSRKAGVVALSLNSQTVFSRGKDALEPVVVLAVPAW
jgi:hypothetical protein